VRGDGGWLAAVLAGVVVPREYLDADASPLWCVVDLAFLPPDGFAAAVSFDARCGAAAWTVLAGWCDAATLGTDTPERHSGSFSSGVRVSALWIRASASGRAVMYAAVFG
jgi:hypothetical protein